MIVTHLECSGGEILPIRCDLQCRFGPILSFPTKSARSRHRLTAEKWTLPETDLKGCL